MRHNFLSTPLALVSAMAIVQIAHADSFRVGDIRVEGVVRLTPANVYNILPMSSGDNIDDAAIAKAVRTLYESKNFDDVQVERVGNVLVFKVVERPVIAKIELDGNKLIPKDGVYAVDVFVDNQKYLGLLSIGFRETVTNSREHRVEVNILDFDREIYGETIRLEFLGHLRDEKKFDSLDDLITAMNQDKENAIKHYSK